jgi:hypothetical protein
VTDGTWLALGLVGALAAASGRRGSRDVERAVREDCLLDDEPDDAFYHALPSRLVDRVLSAGLTPDMPGNWPTGTATHWSRGKVFLAAGIVNGRWWRDRMVEQLDLDVTLLRVALPPEWQRRLRMDQLHWHESGDRCSFYLEESVPPEFLSVA